MPDGRDPIAPRPTARARRAPLVGITLALAVIAGACSSSDTATPRRTDPPTRPTKEQLDQRFTEGYIGQKFALPENRAAATRPTAPPAATSLPADVPITHVIFVIKENRTFDHYFGRYPGVDGTTSGRTIDGTTVPLKPAPDVMDVPITHGFWSGLFAIDGGRMDGFNTIIGGDKLDGYVQFDREAIPNYWAYADRFVLGDRFFTSEYGPTFPEHLYTVAADSYGIMDNKTKQGPTPGRFCDDPQGYAPAFPQNLTAEQKAEIMRHENTIVDNQPTSIRAIIDYLVRVRACLSIPSLPERLSAAGVEWKFYSTPEFPLGDALRAIRTIRYSDLWKQVVPSDSFISDIRDGQLAPVSWVNPPAPYNEHPILPDRSQSVCAGENWTVSMMNTLQESPYWEHSAVIMTWDDFGGFYDHVPPPQYDVMGLGPRAPVLIMSPWTVRGSNRDGGAIDHHTYEFSSVLRFIEHIFDIQPMTERDAQADPLTGAFDFSQPPRLDPYLLPLRQDCPYGTTPPFTDADNLNPDS